MSSADVISAVEAPGNTLPCHGFRQLQVVLAEGFARIFFRNCVATGELYPCECTDRLCDVLKTGDVVTRRPGRSDGHCEKHGQNLQVQPLGDVRPVVDAGGLFNYARQSA